MGTRDAQFLETPKEEEMKTKDTLRKHTYSNILKISPPKTESFHIKILIFYIYIYISAQKIDCGYSLEPTRRGGSNKYQQSMFLSRNKKNNVNQFYYIKVGSVQFSFEIFNATRQLSHIEASLKKSGV